MLGLCEREQIRLLIPTIDTELPAYAKNREAFARVGTTVAVSAPETIAIGADKRRTHRFLIEHNLPTVEQADIADVRRDPGGWSFPFLVKPTAGSAGVGINLVSRVEALDVLASGDDYIVQAIAPGAEYTVDIFVDGSGISRCAVPRRRIEVRGGEVSKAVTVRLPEVMQLAHSVANALPGAFGVLTVQIFFDDTTGRANVIEVNPRFGGGFPLSYAAGADFPAWLISMAVSGDAGVVGDDTCWSEGLLMLRYDDSVVVRLDDFETRA
jgi:carbamoyl-phosphate synthase large subunit